jgi:NAD(P)-dependent dehydrogenase (short-subunit alcohol dehydrogenase family)
MGLLEGHRIIVTGSASGIGAAAVRLFAAEGATVVGLDKAPGADVVVDVADGPATTAAVNAAVERLGGLTGVFANAGAGMVKALHDYSDDEWRWMIDTNLGGVFNTVRAAVRHMGAGGAIVTNSSLAGTKPTWGEAPMCAAKAGVVTLTLSIALEYAPKIRANCISPGFIESPMTAVVTGNPAWRKGAEAGTPLGRLGTVDDVASLAAFLLSDRASYITGQNIGIDGGSALPSVQVDAILRAMGGG